MEHVADRSRIKSRLIMLNRSVATNEVYVV